jgi:hypothetical protein
MIIIRYAGRKVRPENGVCTYVHTYVEGRKGSDDGDKCVYSRFLRPFIPKG